MSAMKFFNEAARIQQKRGSTPAKVMKKIVKVKHVALNLFKDNLDWVQSNLRGYF